MLSQITGDDAYLGQAEAIAAAALRDLTVPPGILTEPDERRTAASDRDRPQFKGIFVRHLYELHQHRPRRRHRDFILANAPPCGTAVTAATRSACPDWSLRPGRRGPAVLRPRPLNAAVGVTLLTG